MKGPRRIAAIVWGVMAFGIVDFAAVIWFLIFPTQPPVGVEANVLFPPVVCLVIAAIVFSSLARRTFRGGGEGKAATRHLILVAAYEAPCLFALVGWLVTCNPIFLLPGSVSFAFLLAMFPSSALWVRLGGEEPGVTPGNPPNPMVRS